MDKKTPDKSPVAEPSGDLRRSPASETNGPAQATELEVFLPQDGSGIKDSSGKYKVTVVPRSPEGGRLNDGKDIWDPFQERERLEHPTSDCDTLTHLLKASLGTGILAMPIAFKNAGLTVGIFCTILVAFVCTHCSYVLVKCAHALYHRTRVSHMSFGDVAEVGLANGPPWIRPYAKFLRATIEYGLFITYFGTCSVYTVIIATNIQQVTDYYLGYSVDVRLMIALWIIPLILLGWVPNLKYLAPFSLVANVFMLVGLCITFYYLVTDMPSISERSHYAPAYNLTTFFSIVIFAMEAIGVMMPLENNMRTPQHFVGICGVLSQGMSFVTLIYIFLGFLGYLKYGDDTAGSITLNLPITEIPAQAVKILIALAVYCTYGLQYYVCLEIIWNALKEHCSSRPKFWEYVVRTVLVTASVLLAIAVPAIGPLIGLIGALCFSYLGLLVPCLIEVIIFWDNNGLGRFYWRLWKNVALSLFGIMALIFGTYTSMIDIIAAYAPQSDQPLNGTIALPMNISSTNSTF